MTSIRLEDEIPKHLVIAKRMINSNANGRGAISELVITNYKEIDECIKENSILKMAVSN